MHLSMCCNKCSLIDMDETEDLLRRVESDNQLQESVKALKDCLKDDFFGIWVDKKQDIHAYCRVKRQGRGVENGFD